MKCYWLFCAFRFFDILKYIQLIKQKILNGAKGVIMDDIIAGIYSFNIIMLYKIIYYIYEKLH